MSAAPKIEKLVDKKELSSMTGLSARTIEHAKDEMGLPFFKIGRSVRYYYSEVIDWIQNKKIVKTRSEK